MVPHKQEHPAFIYRVETERQALLSTKALRSIPQKASNRLLTATWNLTNFGLQKRTGDDLALMAEIIGWFDLVAIQEIADSLIHLRLLLSHLPPVIGSFFPISVAMTNGRGSSMTVISSPGWNWPQRLRCRQVIGAIFV